MLQRLVRLEIALYLLPVSLLVGTNIPLFSAGGRTVYLGTNEIVLALLVLGLLARRMRGQTPPPLPSDLMLSLAVFSVILPLSLFVNIYTTGDWPAPSALVEVVRWFEYLLIIPSVFWIARSERQIKNLLCVVGFFTLANVAVSFYQAATFNVSVSRIYGLFVSAANREGNSISNPNVIGALFMCSALFFLAFALNQSGGSRNRNLIFMGASIIAMALSLSRSAMLGFLVGVFVLSFFYKEQRRLFLAIGLGSFVVLGATVIASDVILNRILNTLQITGNTQDARSAHGRLEDWGIIIMRTLDNPVLGVGYGDMEHRILWLTADNYYVDIFAMTGLLGLFALFAILWQIYAPIQRARLPERTFGYTFKSGFLASYAAFLVANLFGGLLSNPRLIGLFWLLSCLMLQTVRLHRQGKLT